MARGVPKGLSWEDDVGLEAATSRTDMIHGPWRGKDHVSLILMGMDVWRSTRLLRLQSSRHFFILNNDLLDSTKRMQTVWISQKSESESETAETQDMAHFLRASLRLNAQDVSLVLATLQELGWQETYDLAGNFRLDKGPEQAPTKTVEAALKALSHAVTYGYKERIPAALVIPARLLSLAETEDISATQRELMGCWTVVVHLKGRAAAEVLRQRQPSYFINGPASGQPHVHILEPMLVKRCSQILTFGTRPSKDEIDDAVAAIRMALDLPARGKYLATNPLSPVCDIWFRADGDIKLNVQDNVLAPALRSALRREGKGSDLTMSCEIGIPSPEQRAAATFVIWTRQSNEDTRRARDSITRQLATILSSPLLQQLSPDDNLIVLAETCSSFKHPLTDRRIYHSLPRNKPIHLLTVNPDRLTRRSDEVHIIRKDLSHRGGSWHSSGLSLGDKTEKEGWHMVDDGVAEQLKAHLRLERQRALQMGHYWRRDQAAVRLTDVIDRAFERATTAAAIATPRPRIGGPDPPV